MTLLPVMGLVLQNFACALRQLQESKGQLYIRIHARSKAQNAQYWIASSGLICKRCIFVGLARAVGGVPLMRGWHVTLFFEPRVAPTNHRSVNLDRSHCLTTINVFN